MGVATSEVHVAEQGPEVYGCLTKVCGVVKHLQLVRFSYERNPEITGVDVRRCDHARARTLRYWKGPFGIAENTYIHTPTLKASHFSIEKPQERPAVAC